MSVIVKGMKMPTCCADCRFFIYADFEDFVECSALVEFMAKDKVPEGRRNDCPLVDEESVIMTKETRGNIIQGVTIAQKHLQHAQSTKPNEDFIVLPVNTARHLESILEQVLHAVAEDEQRGEQNDKR